MSLLQKASIITTPTAYAEDYLYSIKPALSLGAEQITNGNFESNVNGWGTDSGATLTWQSDKTALVTSTADTTFAITQTNALVVGRKYRVSFIFKPNNTGKFRVRLGGGTESFATTNFNVDEFNSVEFDGVAEGTTIELGSAFPSNITSFFIDRISVKEITDADFDFDRNSTGTRVNEDYLIEDVPYNLVPYSEDFTQSNYSKTRCTVTANQAIAPDGTLTADLMTATGDDARLEDQIGFSGERYTQSIFVKSAQATNVAGQIDFAGANIVTFTATDRWQRITSTLTDTTINPRVRVRITNNGDALHIWGAQVVKGDQPKDYLKTTDRLDIPRIDYTNGEPSILLEPQRQNEVTYSQDFTQGVWNKNNVTVTSNQAISPEGIQNADKVVIDNGTFTINGGLYVQRIGVINQDVSFSIFAKAGEFRYGTISYGSSNANGFNFDLEDGVILSTFTAGSGNYTNIGYEMIPYPNGWYRLIVKTTELKSNNRFIGIRPHNTIPTGTNNNYSSTGDGTSGIFIYGGQIEVGSYATSLIHTSGSTVTRSQDAANNAGNSDLINSTEGVLYAEIKALADDGTFRLLSLSDGTSNNRVYLGFNNTNNVITANLTTSGSSQGIINHTIADTTLFNKVAIKYKANDVSLYVNGVEVGVDTSATAPTLSSLQFTSGGGSSVFYGNAKSVMVFKEALSDTELAKLTGYNNHELYMNYYNRLSYLGLVEEYNVESDINNYIL